MAFTVRFSINQSLHSIQHIQNGAFYEEKFLPTAFTNFWIKASASSVFNTKWELDRPIFLQRKDLNVLWLTILNPPPALHVLGSKSDTGLPAQEDLL